MRKKLLLWLFSLLLIVGFGQADWYYNPATGQIDYYEPVSGANFGDLANVTLTGAANGNVLYYNGTRWVNLAIGAVAEVMAVSVAGIPDWVAMPAPGAHAATHELLGLDLVDHDNLTNFVAAEHLLVGAIDHDSLLNYVAGDHIGLPATIATVLTDHNLAAHTALGLNDMANVFYVSATGGDYTTIQAALTAQAIAGATFVVGTGVYANDTIHFTANAQTVKGVGRGINVSVTQADTNIVDAGAFTDCRVVDIAIRLTAPTTAINAIQVDTGSLGIIDCRVYLATAVALVQADQPSIVGFTDAGTIVLKGGLYEYYHTGACGGAAIKAAMRANVNLCLLHLHKIDLIEITNSGTAAVTALYVTTGTAVTEAHNCVDVTVTDPTAVLVIGLGYVGGGGAHNVQGNHVDVVATNNTSYGLYHNGTATIRSAFNAIHASDGAGSSYAFYVGASATLDSHFDDLRSDDGNNIVGTLVMVSSEDDGDLTITNPVSIYSLSHDSFTDYAANQHRVWENSIAQNIHIDNIPVASIDHGTLAGLADKDHLLNRIGNPDGNVQFNMTTRQVRFLFTNPATADGGFEIEASGAFSGDLVHIHQHTGNPGAVDLMHLEADDADVVPLRVTGAGTYDAIIGKLSVTGISNFAGTTTIADMAGAAIGNDVQAWDADLDIYAGITPSANVQTLLANATFALFLADLSTTAAAAFDWGGQNLTNIGSIAPTSIDCGGVITAASYIAIEDTNELRFYDNGNYVGFEPGALDANQIWVLPTADGNAGDVMQTSGAGAGVLSWVANAAGSMATDDLWAAQGDLAYGNAGDTGVILSFNYDGDILRLNASVPYWDGVGISNTNPVVMDADGVDDEYARFTAAGLESRSVAEVLGDIGGQASNAVLTELTNLTDPAADKFLFWNDTTNDFEFSAVIHPIAGGVSVGAAGNAGKLELEDATGDVLGIQVGVQAGNTDYTWPTAFPGTSGWVLASTDAGTMSWAASPAHAMADHTDDDTYNISTSGTAGTGTITVANGGSINLQEDITFTGATGVNLIKFPDHLAEALVLEEAGTSYQTFVTTNGSEEIQMNVGVQFDTIAYFDAEYDEGAEGGAFTIVWANGQKQKVTITGVNLDMSFTDPPGPCNLMLTIIQGDGDDTIDWTHDTKIGGAGGTAPTLSTGAADTDVIAIYFDGTNYWVSVLLDTDLFT